jgi:hypothetical protein
LEALEHGDKEWSLAEWFIWRNLIIGWMLFPTINKTLLMALSSRRPPTQGEQ